MAITPEQLVAELPSLRKQLATAENEAKRADLAVLLAHAQARNAKAKVEALRKAVAGLEGLADVDGPAKARQSVEMQKGDREADVIVELKNGHQFVIEAKGQPRGREAVRLVLRDAAQPLRPKQIVDEVMRRGWVAPDAKDPESSIRVAARRLVDDGLVEVTDGLYSYKLSSGTPDEPAEVSAGGQERLLATEGGDT